MVGDAGSGVASRMVPRRFRVALEVPPPDFKLDSCLLSAVTLSYRLCCWVHHASLFLFFSFFPFFAVFSPFHDIHFHFNTSLGASGGVSGLMGFSLGLSLRRFWTLLGLGSRVRDASEPRARRQPGHAGLELFSG